MTYSLIGSSLFSRGLLNDRTRDLQDIQTQLNTNKKYIDLKQYGADQYKLFNYSKDLSDRQTLANGLGNVLTIQRLTTQSVSSISDLGAEFIKSTQLNNGEELPGGVNKEYITNFFNQLRELLNTEYGGRFIFSGKAFQDEPVKDLNTLPTLDPSVLQTSNYNLLAYNGASTINDQQGRFLGQILPYFRTNFRFNNPQQQDDFINNTDPTQTEFASDNFSYLNNFNDTNAKLTSVTLPGGAVTTAAVTEKLDANYVPVADVNVFANGNTTFEANKDSVQLQRTNELLTSNDIRANETYYAQYGLNATAIPFQQLIYAAINLNSAITGKNADGSEFDLETKKQFVARANEYATKAVENLRGDTTNALNTTRDRLANYHDLHVNFVQVLTSSIDNIEAVDSRQLITSLSNINTLLQQSYYTIKVQQSLFLSNYFS